MYNKFPYDDLAKKIGRISSPFSLNKVENIFKDISSDCKIEKFQQIDIQHVLCDVNLISPKGINEKYLPVPPAYFFYKIQALLISGDNFFYTMIHCGKDPLITNHTFNQTISGMRTESHEYRNLSPGRYLDLISDNFISAEEDEFDVRYILITNSEWLLNSNEIFNYSRNFFTL
jgi:hypothetical protein